MNLPLTHSRLSRVALVLRNQTGSYGRNRKTEISGVSPVKTSRGVRKSLPMAEASPIRRQKNVHSFIFFVFL